MKTSDFLTIGGLYSRKKLADTFNITDMTINTGIFRPIGHESIWLFVTERKPLDRTQYKDRLLGDTLDWDGQTAGRKDNFIIRHEGYGLELLLFYRKHKEEHPGYAFKYEGKFKYKSHSGHHPSHFILVRDIQRKSP
jgi:hypothetical protein